MSVANNTSSAVGVLILIPIAIAGSAAFIAIKTTDFWKATIRRVQDTSPSLQWFSRQRRDRNRSDQSASYADSFFDLESVASHRSQYENWADHTRLLKSSPRSATQYSRAPQTFSKETWHPRRQDRLQWSFANSQSLSPSHFAFSNVLIPSRTHPRPERSQSQDEEVPGL